MIQLIGIIRGLFYIDKRLWQFWVRDASEFRCVGEQAPVITYLLSQSALLIAKYESSHRLILPRQ
jgi:hypothetical protein